MSKIQDAIGKLRTLEERNVSAGNRSTRETAVASLVERASVKPRTPGADRVKLDFDLLRAEGLLAPKEQLRRIADQYRIIKRPLLNNVFGGDKRGVEAANRIMLASALPGDGKTYNCVNLALSMATEKDISVLLVDADVSKRHISRLCGLERAKGLIDALTDVNIDVGSLIVDTNVDGLAILPAGRVDEHATELLASRKMIRLVEDLSVSRPDRIIIFDSPPLLVTSEARVLASLMGQIVFVICALKTPQAAVKEAIDGLDRNKAISIILNQAGRGTAFDEYGGYPGYAEYNSVSAPRDA